ncbi:MAG: sugar phosphate isomerase/epimerase [Phycisphaerae bacterium]|nr:sugar phosphate isomerase/epimerase [Phycisphaerae bacterium]
MPGELLSHPISRRDAVRLGAAALAAASFPSLAMRRADPLFTISLAQWSLHKTLYGGKLDHLDFPRAAKREYGIEAVEYVNSFFKEKGSASYNAELKKRCEDEGVVSVLIMCDGEGDLGDAEESRRAKAVENHRKWVEAAKALGCHSIRVNAKSSGTPEEQRDRSADGLRRLCELADPYAINVIVENHGGLSSNGAWLAGVMKAVNHPRVGTLPDFGNFQISPTEKYDIYTGVEELMPFAKGVSAKSHDFEPVTGDETTKDYRRLLSIVMKANYHGYIGIEYEGSKLSEPDGIRATKKLLERLREEFRPEHP